LRGLIIVNRKEGGIFSSCINAGDPKSENFDERKQARTI
jgi:hypothetical protein